MNYLHRLIRYPALYAVLASLLVLLAMSVAVWQGKRYIEEDVELALGKALGVYSATLEDGTNSSQAMGAAILFGLENQAARQMVSGKLPPDAPAVHSALEAMRAQFIANAAFLVDQRGWAVAYSGKNRLPGTGQDLSFLPCVKLALQGSPNVYPAIGLDGVHRSIYLAAPLRAAMDNGAQPIGAVVIEVGADKLDLLLSSWADGIAMLVSPQGVVFSASRADWLFHEFGVSSAAVTEAVRHSRQFGRMFERQPPVPLSFTPATPEVDIEGVHYAVRSVALEWNDPQGDWKLVMLGRDRDWWSDWRILGMTGATGLVAVLALFWLYTLARNVTRIDVMNARLRRNEQELRTLIENSPDTIARYDRNCRRTYVNPAFGALSKGGVDALLGRTPSEMPGGEHSAIYEQRIGEVFASGQDSQFELKWLGKDGRELCSHIRLTAERNLSGTVTSVLGIGRDITELNESRAELRQANRQLENMNVKLQSLATSDPLTQLPNRRLLMDRLKHAQASSVRTGQAGALLFIDLDNFKTINDKFGHDSGDLLLQQVAARLQACVREVDTVARLGGDEFVVMLEDLSKDALEAAAQAEAAGNKVLAVLNHPYQLVGQECGVTPSIGITLFLGQQQPAEELLKQADIAMYESKKVGRNTLHFFDPQMQESMDVRAAIEVELHQSLEQGHFRLYYQVQLDNTRRPLGAEALIRWEHPERGLVPPAQFIPVAEETGLILRLGHWVLEAACAQLKRWEQDELTRHLVLAVNVSARQFRQDDFVAQVQALVRRHGINPKLLKLELTESLLLENVEDTIATMNAIKQIGVQFSLDDFGTGYSSLQYLKRLPLNQLKIDRSFVRDIVVDANDRVIVTTIIAMAQSLNLDVIAEGVETEEQLQLLMHGGCKHFQGYMFGKPLPVAQFQESLRQG